MGCRFCATGTMGIIGDLTSAEILEQWIYAQKISKLRNVVFMGMGEPLNNYENVKRAVRRCISTLYTVHSYPNIWSSLSFD